MLIKSTKMKKITEIQKRNKSCHDLLKSSWSKFCSSKVKHCLCFMMVIGFIMPSICSCEDDDNVAGTSVPEAYELRISGKADQAEEMLNDLLKSDSTDALAHFELARTKQHLFLGGTQFTSEEWEEVVGSSRQAARHDPDNEIFAFYHAYTAFFDAYISMMMQKPDAGEKVTLTCDAFQDVLNLDPDCYEAMLYLVDIYAYLPEEMGGDRGKASLIASDLNQTDKEFGPLAYARLLPDTANLVLYWENVQKETGNNAQVLEELGRAYLLNSDTENGTKFFLDAINEDTTKRYLYMHLVRYHLLSSQQTPDAREEHLTEAEELENTYLQSSPDLTPPSKAYAYGMLAMIKMFSGDNQAGSEYQATAASIDPYYSKAMSIPSEILYCRRDEVKIHYNSFFMPF